MTDSETTVTENNTAETRTEKSNKKKLWIGGIAAGLALIVASVGITLAVTEGFDDFGDDDDTSQEVRDGGSTDSADAGDAAVSDGDRQKAEKAALAEVGEGTVTDVERSDDGDHAYEVDVTLADGTEVDVELDESFAVTKVDKA